MNVIPSFNFPAVHQSPKTFDKITKFFANTVRLLQTYQSVSSSTSEAPSSCWTWPLGEAAACGTSRSCHTLAGRWCRRTADSADEAVCRLCDVSAGESWSSGGRTRSWSSLNAQWRGSSCTDQCWAHRRTPHTSRDSWCRAGNDEELQRTTTERKDSKQHRGWTK